MLRTVVENRAVLSFLLSSGAGYLLLRRFPFPSDDNVLQLIALEKPWLFDAAHWSYTAMLFSTPLICILIDICTAVHLCGQDPSRSYVIRFRRIRTAAAASSYSW